jgi:RHS repeat-associated protein
MRLLRVFLLAVVLGLIWSPVQTLAFARLSFGNGKDYVQVQVTGQATSEFDYGYDSYGRLSSANYGVYSAAYAYAPNSDLLRTTTSKNDYDGNLTGDGLWTYTWDAENRLTKIESVSSLPNAAKRKLEFGYDNQGRRIWSKISTNNGSYVVSRNTRFVYDGWNLVAELNATNNAPQRTYLWGNDLSGTMDRAGGIGGLVAIRDHGAGTYHFTCYDGNGNIMALVNAADQSISAQYEYSPFGELIRATGPMARANPLRWSSKYTDDETDLVYYGYRFYSPSFGRWLSKDPIEEWGGLNLYGFVGNSPINAIDRLGLEITYYYGNEASSIFYPDGSVPYLNGETAWEMLIASAYNTIPLINNINSKIFEPLTYFITQVGDEVTELTGNKNAGEGLKYGLFAATMAGGRCPNAGNIANKLPRFGGFKPRYVVNPAHVPSQRLRFGKTPLSNNAEAVFKHAVPNDPMNPTAWFGRNPNGQIYRYSVDRNGIAHFSGILGVDDGTRNITQ